MLPLPLFVIHPFVERAVTDAPLTALVPISILTDPEDMSVLERFPSAISPLPEIVILRVGRMRPVTRIPLIIPLALDPTNVSFQLIGLERAPLPTTVPVPICEAKREGIFKNIAQVTASTRMMACIFHIEISSHNGEKKSKEESKKALQMSRVFIFVFSSISFWDFLEVTSNRQYDDVSIGTSWSFDRWLS
jgi:hypothetical protein